MEVDDEKVCPCKKELNFDQKLQKSKEDTRFLEANTKFNRSILELAQYARSYYPTDTELQKHIADFLKESVFS